MTAIIEDIKEMYCGVSYTDGSVRRPPALCCPLMITDMECKIRNLHCIPYSVKRWWWKTLANPTKNYIGEKILAIASFKTLLANKCWQLPIRFSLA